MINKHYKLIKANPSLHRPSELIKQQYTDSLFHSELFSTALDTNNTSRKKCQHLSMNSSILNFPHDYQDKTRDNQDLI